MWINGIDIADYGGQLRMEYKTSEIGRASCRERV